MKKTIILIILVIAAFFGAKPGYRFFREWRIERNASAARDAFDAKDYSDARSLALAVLNSRPNQFDMIKILHRSLEELNSEDTPSAAIAVMKHPKASPAEKLDAFQSATHNAPTAFMIRLWLQLDPEVAASVEYLDLIIERLLSEGDVGRAAQLIAAATTTTVNPDILMLAIKTAVRSGRPEVVEIGQNAISEMISRDDPRALEAFRFLRFISPQHFRSGYFPDLQQWISSQDQATVADQLIGLRQEVYRNRPYLEPVTEKAIATYAEEDPEAVATWLMRIKEFRAALKVLSPEFARSSHKLFTMRAEALIEIHEWDAVSEWLSQPPKHYPQPELNALRVLAIDPNDPTTSGFHEWTEALFAAEQDSRRNAFLDISELMKRHRRSHLANEALLTAVTQERGTIPLWLSLRHLLPWLRAHKTDADLYRFCGSCARLEPGLPEIMIELIDIGTLLEKFPLDIAIDSLDVIPPDGLNDLRRLEVLSTLQLLSNQPEKALETVGSIPATERDTSRLIAITKIAEAELEESSAAPRFLEIDWDQMTRLEARVLRDHYIEAMGPKQNDEITPLPEPKPLPEITELPEDPVPLEEISPLKVPENLPELL
ncbi:MAG: hypothetical protein ACQKBU_06595, partial [Verrucomicrobiales bacterium]